MALRQAHSAVIVPKLKDAGEREKARIRLEADVKAFQRNGGKIELVPNGLGKDWDEANRERSEAGKRGARKNAISRGYRV